MLEKAVPVSPEPASGALVSLQSLLLCMADAPQTSFNVALDTMAAQRFRECPNEVQIEGFILLDTGIDEPVLALVALDLFWRMQGMDILVHTRSSNRDRRVRPQEHFVSGSVWLVDGTLEGQLQTPADSTPAEEDHGEGVPHKPAASARRRLNILAVHALDRVSLESRGPRFIERIDIQTMLPRFASDEA
jgi:hypothetical protein